MGTCNCVFFYFDTALQLVGLIVGVMNLIRFVILLYMGRGVARPSVMVGPVSHSSPSPKPICMQSVSIIK